MDTSRVRRSIGLPPLGHPDPWRIPVELNSHLRSFGALRAQRFSRADVVHPQALLNALVRAEGSSLPAHPAFRVLLARILRDKEWYGNLHSILHVQLLSTSIATFAT